MLQEHACPGLIRMLSCITNNLISCFLTTDRTPKSHEIFVSVSKRHQTILWRYKARFVLNVPVTVKFNMLTNITVTSTRDIQQEPGVTSVRKHHVRNKEIQISNFNFGQWYSIFSRPIHQLPIRHCQYQILSEDNIDSILDMNSMQTCNSVT